MNTLDLAIVIQAQLSAARGPQDHTDSNREHVTVRNTKIIRDALNKALQGEGIEACNDPYPKPLAADADTEDEKVARRVMKIPAYLPVDKSVFEQEAVKRALADK